MGKSLPKPRRSLGQVFLKQTWPGERMIQELKKWGVEKVLEIGPGHGILTKALIQNNFYVTCVEKDDRLAGNLRAYVQDRNYHNVEVVSADILRFDLKHWLEHSTFKKAVIGNIPYNISTPILNWVLPYLKALTGVIFLVQKEYAERIVAPPSTKKYGSLSVYLQLRCHIETLCHVSKNNFFPVPKVDSTLIALINNHDQPNPDLLKQVEQISKACFTKRRKKLSNCLKSVVKNPAALTSPCPIDLSRRPETLLPEEFIKLALWCRS